jgi:hypothetical protein
VLPGTSHRSIDRQSHHGNPIHQINLNPLTERRVVAPASRLSAAIGRGRIRHSVTSKIRKQQASLINPFGG